MSSSRSTALVCALLFAPLPSLSAQSAAACQSEAFHQFDFWLGAWAVHTPAGALAGTNRIDTILGGCALQEHWTGSKGGSGTSLNYWSPADSRWHQVWLDSGGNLLQLTGGLELGAMVLRGQHPDPARPGVVVIERITWTPLDGGRVRQLWESSSDAGVTWVVQFDGLYTVTP